MTMTILGLFGLSILFVWLMKLTETKGAANRMKPLNRNTKITFIVVYLFGVVGGLVNRSDILEILVVPAIPALLAGVVVHLIFGKKSKN
ncbi:hypothetical protein MCEMSE18_00281 [Candidatus Planktophila versatilis]|uniref:hypothetical protein n=1 Tax=Candidatus Planktophila versatilis TaxID=1884905 RepID=UPI003BEF3840